MAKSKLVGKPKNIHISFSDRKLEVLRAAARLFNRHGYHNTTMDDIAAALGVTKPALYYYAKSKDEVLYEVITYAVKEAEAAMLPAMNEGDTGAERLRIFFDAWSRHVCGDFGRCLVQTHPKSLESKTRRKNRLARRNLHQQIENSLCLGMKDGSIRAADPKLLALGLFDLFNGIAHWHDPGGRLSPEDIAGEYWRTFFSGILV